MIEMILTTISISNANAISENTDGNVQQLHRLTHDQLQIILRSDSLQVAREVEVFQVAVKWLR